MTCARPFSGKPKAPAGEITRLHDIQPADAFGSPLNGMSRGTVRLKIPSFVPMHTSRTIAFALHSAHARQKMKEFLRMRHWVPPCSFDLPLFCFS
jgi:hypothetical protein